MKYPFTKIFFKPREKDIPEEKELLKDPHKESDHTLVDHTLKDPPKELPQEKEIPKDPPEKKELPEEKKVSIGYATKPEDRPDKPYQGWWNNQMEVAKNMYPNYDQTRLNETVMDWWNKHTDKNKINIWARHDAHLELIKKSRKTKKESVV